MYGNEDAGPPTPCRHDLKDSLPNRPFMILKNVKVLCVCFEFEVFREIVLTDILLVDCAFFEERKLNEKILSLTRGILST